MTNNQILTNRVKRMVKEAIYKCGNDFKAIIAYMEHQQHKAEIAATAQLTEARKNVFASLAEAISLKIIELLVWRN